MEQRQRISRACDACKLRKVKCNGQIRCQQCTHLDLRCIYSPATTKKRVQGKRGRVITEYKQKTAGAKSGESPLLPTTPDSPLLPTNEEYDANFFLNLIPDYMDSVYPVNPIIAEAEVRECIEIMGKDEEAKSFVLSFGAVTLNLTCTGERRTENVAKRIEHLITRSIQIRGAPKTNIRTTVRKAMTSLFLHNCLMTMRDSDTAFYYMREAISFVQLLRIDSPLPGTPDLPSERARRQRLYWEAYIHERFLAILDYRPAIMPPLSSLPEADDTIPLTVQEGFNQIIKLFQLIDTDFLNNWLGSHNESTVTSAWVERKHKELDTQDEDDDYQLTVLTTMQRADLVITRQWLRTLIWRLAIPGNLLSSKSPKNCLSLLFPVRLSQKLRQQVTSMSREAIEIHGSGIVQKLFEITDTLADVLINIPAGTLEETALRVEDFVFLLTFLFAFPTLDQTRRGILTTKLETLQNMFPAVAASPSTAASASPMQEYLAEDPWYQVASSMIPEDTPADNFELSRMEHIFPPNVNSRLQRNEIARRLSILDSLNL